MQAFPHLHSAGHVLLVDDSPVVLSKVSSLLTEHGLEVTAVSSGREALALATSGSRAFDVFILDVMMPDMSGHELTRALRADPGTTHVPILILTALDSTANRVAGFEAGADDFFPKSVADEEMLARVRSFISLGQMRGHLLAQREAMSRLQFDSPVPSDPTGTSVVLVHGAQGTWEPFVGLLRASLPASIALSVQAGSGATHADLGDTDLVLATYDLALGADGLLARFGIMQETAPPVIVVDGAETAARRVSAFEAGADDYLVAQRPAEELVARIAGAIRRHQRHTHLRRERDRAVLAAVTDPLTGLHNRGFFQESLSVEVLRSRRYGRPLSLLLVDIDHFKLVNDALGHAAGDKALREVADRMRKTARATDVVARYGGEEFAVLLPETAHANALIAGERIRAAVDGTPVIGRAGTRALTISVGVATCPDNATEADKLLEQVDTALYAAKTGGRNRVAGASTQTGAPSPFNPRRVAANELVDRLRALLADDLESPLASTQRAAKLLREGTAEEDPLYAATVRLLDTSTETRASLEQLLADLLRFVDQNR